MNRFLPEILMIKESWNLIPPMVCIWPHPTMSRSQRCYVPCDDYLFSDIADLRILSSDWTRGLTSHTQPKVVALDTTFPWWLTPCKKSEISLGSFQRYWWLKNHAIWLNRRNPWPHPTKSGRVRCYLLLVVIYF